MLLWDILNAFLLILISLECFRVLQSCSYKPQRGYFKIFATVYFATLIVTQVLVLIFYYFVAKWSATAVLFVAAFVVTIKKRKCPLKITKRILRMLIAQFCILIALCLLFSGAFCVMALPVVCLLSWLICLPIDSLIANFYLKKAVKKLSKTDIEVVAITGSYGKTCTKDMLSTLLEGGIAPSGSCNTPLGIANFINKTDLSPYKFLVLEFGARNKGDIKQLCDLYKPKYGIITGICEQHLSTFKTLDNIVQTKGELAQSLPSDGFCILNGADDHLKHIVPSCNCYKFFTNKAFVSNAKSTLNGTFFDVLHDNKTYSVHLPQISSYIVDTFLMSFEMCLALGQSAKLTTSKCKDIKQTPHRMQISHNGMFYIVDDAYNANIKGVKSCCCTLEQFDNYKIALTQGIVEGGKKQGELNQLCGQMLGGVFDVVMAVGKFANQIASGAKCGKAEVVCAKSLNQAMQQLSRYTKPNCIVLFQNDLPDVVGL